MKKLKFVHSLRFRLFLLVALVGIAPNIALRIGVLASYESRAVSNRSIDVLSQAKVLGSQVVTYNYIADTSSEVINAQLKQLSNIYDGRVLLVNPGFQIVKDTYGLDTGKTIISEEVVRSFQGEEITKYDSKNRYIELSIPLKSADAEGTQGVMLVSVSTDSIMMNYDFLRDNAHVIEIASGILILLAAFFCAKLLVLPFGKMTKS